MRRCLHLRHQPGYGLNVVGHCPHGQLKFRLQAPYVPAFSRPVPGRWAITCSTALRPRYSSMKSASFAWCEERFVRVNPDRPPAPASVHMLRKPQAAQVSAGKAKIPHPGASLCFRSILILWPPDTQSTLLPGLSRKILWESSQACCSPEAPWPPGLSPRAS